jgi:hypothetical protein
MPSPSACLTTPASSLQDPEIKVENDEEAKAGKVSFKGKAHSHATGAR